MTRLRPVTTALLALNCVTPSLPAQAAARVPITAATVTAALGGSGIAVRSTQIELPAALSSTDANPELYVTGAELLPNNQIRIHLACRLISHCQPFFATVLASAGEDPAAGLLRLQQNRHSITGDRGPEAEQRLIAGQRTTLLLEDTHMRITLPVLAIDSGAPGAAVRVSSLDRKQVYRAVVTELGTVRGNLQ